MPDPLQRVVGLVLAVVSFPAVAVLSLLVRLDSPGPVLYQATRVGARGVTFTCFKLRTMTSDASEGSPLSTQRDGRVTRVGRLLRRARLDELPQLWNVARGDMRLVGPRPEDPRFVDLANDLHRYVFTARPGITGLAQLAFLDEAALLDPTRPAESYRDAVQPSKLALDARYLANRDSRLDLWILWATIRALAGSPPSELELHRRAPLMPVATGGEPIEQVVPFAEPRSQGGPR